MSVRTDRHPGKRLSPLRVLIGVAVVLAVTGAAIVVPWQLSRTAPITTAGAGPHWFGGYFDVTAAPVSEQPNASDASDTVVLAFIVAQSDMSCVPTWGGAYGLRQAGSELDLDRRVDQMRRDGTHVAVSFGGAINTELASACASVPDLIKAYSAVLDRYDITTIDLDLEGENLADTVAAERRADAVAALQQQREATGGRLDVWVTLPVATDGLTEEGLQAVRTLLRGGVDLAGVNVMTMNYGTDLNHRSIADVSIDALEATHDQLADIYAELRIGLPAEGAWAVLGATPMIGQNDIASEVFTIDDARELNAFARKTKLARLSMWSLNRDRQCGTNYPDLSVVSDACSGVDQAGLSFAGVLANGFDGERLESDDPAPTPFTPVPDDPATSPYPIWSPETSYSAGVRVVWHGYVYSAKWWVTGGPQPDDPIATADQTSWVLVGPVMPDDEPFALPTLPTGTYPEWSETQAFEKGARVMFEGVGYRAKWWTLGDLPSDGITDRDRSPWALIDEE